MYSIRPTEPMEGIGIWGLHGQRIRIWDMMWELRLSLFSLVIQYTSTLYTSLVPMAIEKKRGKNNKRIWDLREKNRFIEYTSTRPRVPVHTRDSQDRLHPA